jgi:hypothetical protein
MLSTVAADEATARELRADLSVTQAALAVIIGVIVSGPVAVLVVTRVHPQPAWQGAARFADELHPIQLLPYAGGFVLVGGLVALIASLHTLAPATHRARSTFALALAAAFAALIVLNYVLQTTFVPALARPYRPENDALIAALSISNPRSLAWALEMWGYALLGVATWAIAPVFRDAGIERAAAATYGLNGVISVAGGVATALAPGWVMTVPGGIAYAAWNAVVVIMAIFTIIAMRRRARLVQSGEWQAF